MKIFKNKITGIFVAVCLLFGSCTDLSETVYDRLTDDTIDINDPEVLGAQMGKAYSQLLLVYWTWEGYFDLQEECSDTYMTPERIGVGWGAQYIPMHKHTWVSSAERHPWHVWQHAYEGIGYANKALDILPAEGNPQAQMRFLRALKYYLLLDAFRWVPLELTQDIEPGYLPEQVSPETLFAFCVSELEAIKDDLGKEKYFGIPNRWAACMTLAKLYLNYYSYFPNETGTEYYEKALAEVEEVLKDGGYALAPNYLDNFKRDINDSPEVIFAIPQHVVYARFNYLSNKCLTASGAAAYGFLSEPWNGSCAVPNFLESYQAGDKRLRQTWTWGVQRYYTEDGGPQSGAPIAETTHDGTGAGVLNYSVHVNSIDNPGGYFQQGARFVKSQIYPDNFGAGANDVAFYRLADAMFIKAECLLRLGRDKQTAADLVSQVRARSFESPAQALRTVADLEGGSRYPYGFRENTRDTWLYAPYTNLTPAGVPTPPMDFYTEYTFEGGDDIILGGLLDDLGWEFVGEHHRRQDLIRFKMTDGRNVFNGKSWFCKRATTETYWDYFPIPQPAREANIKLFQTEGYQE